MKPTYLFQVESMYKPVIGNVSEPTICPHWMITRLNVPQEVRGLGYGTELLRRITEDADKDNLALCLLPQASGGLDHDRLIAWYERYGFMWVESGACGMIRPPLSYRRSMGRNE